MVPATPDDLFALFDRLDIRAATHRHAPAFTVEEGHRVWGSIPGVHCKNLFLKDGKGRLWLVVAPAERRIDLKSLPERIGSARLSFGSAALLVEVLGIEPGSVTPFAVINDREHRVSVVLDAWMMAQERINYHPLRNDMTTTLSPAELERFFRHTGHTPLLVDL
ncbi:prolyl-tRNA synthetase associated domain-containing protein [Magnetospirillum sp. 15-1]|uniref:prolyl-tRNA synthetase associated domain-containing protein n=1 Tax=Magnetospirillum sp. 15-1 TaxID=1979370 RepID=UPI000BBB7D3C|nr:prolyl-tRNA synthetase associated domain-containing protein [Magnetospirillum sp. 15-1]